MGRFIANIIIVPMVPFAMLLSFLAELAGMIVPSISGYTALPVRILLDAMLLITTWFAKLPMAQKLVSLSAIVAEIFYTIIIIFIIALNKRVQSVKIKA